MLHNAILVGQKRLSTSPSLLSDPVRTSWCLAMMATSTQGIAVYFGDHTGNSITDPYVVILFLHQYSWYDMADMSHLLPTTN
jgi:hypothetical protein